MNDEELSFMIRERATRHSASERLRAAVQTQIALQSIVHQEKPALADRLKAFGQMVGLFDSKGGSGATVTNSAGASKIATLGLGFVSGVALTLALIWMVPRIQAPGIEQSAMLGDLVSLHVRSIGTGTLFQEASSDRHTVKPWFQGKLDYAPEVADLSADGFELLGGRIDRLQGHDTAVIAYQMRKHIISAYVMPTDKAAPMERLQQRGFNIVHWSDGVMQVWAVSDVEATEMDRFGSAWLLRVAPSQGGTQ